MVGGLLSCGCCPVLPQEPKTDQDEEHCRKVNEYLNNPPMPGALGASGSGGHELSALGGNAPLPLPVLRGPRRYQVALDDADQLWFFKTDLREWGKGREASLAAALVRSLVGPRTRLDQGSHSPSWPHGVVL